MVVDLQGDDIPVVSGGTPVALWTARTGPNLVQDTGDAWGVPTYVPAGSGLNGHAGIRFNRNTWDILKWAAPFNNTTAEDWSILVVHDPTTPPADANTRGYVITGTDLPGGASGTRFGVAQNANDSINFADAGWAAEPAVLGAEKVGQNPPWHSFYNDIGVRQLGISGPQVNLWVFGDSTFMVRATAGSAAQLVGRSLPGFYPAARRGMSVRAVLGSNAAGVIPGTSTSDFLDGKVYLVQIWRGPMGVQQGHVVVNAAKAIFLP